MAKRRGAQFWRAHVEAFERSDVTQREYCAQHGLAERGFYRWRCKYKEALATGNGPLTLVQLSMGTAAAGGMVVLRSPGGWTIELPAHSVSQLTELVRQLP